MNRNNNLITDLNKELSIFVGLFKKIHNNSYEELYNNIKKSDFDPIELNGMTFYNNLSDKNYFLLYILYYEDNEKNKNFKLLGDAILKSENFYNKENMERIGKLKGVMGKIGFSFRKNLNPGNYELMILTKEVQELKEFEEIRNEIKADKNKIKELNFKISASAPFNVEE